MRRLLLLILCLCSIGAAQGQEAYDWRYWFDQSPTYEQGSSNDGTLHLDVDVSGLTKSLHQIHIQVRDAAGKFSEPVTRYFYVPEDGHGDTKLRYWFDQDNNTMNIVDLMQGMFDLDVSSLESGIHVLSFIATNDRGEQSDPQSRFFIVPEKDADEEAMFYYWFDENHTDMVSAPVGDGALMLDVASLSEGIHILHSYIKKDGRMSEPKHQVFVKQPVGGNAIAYYSYWLNEADTQRSVVKVDEPTNPYELIDMLLVEPQPLRSSSFHFEVADGQPTMYAKNDIHLTFTDLYGQESKPVSKKFVDVNTSEIVTDIAELQNTQTFARPEENKVKWFSFKAAPKDSVSLKSSQATSIQVFDAVGNELYAADGTASTKFDGCRIAEEGTYYVAVHDVTGTKSDVTLDAQFDRTLFALTYIVDGDTLKTDSYVYCATIEPLSTPEKEGHTFSGWSEIPEAMPAHDVSVTGTFTVNQYKLSFVVDGDTLSSAMVDYGTELAAIDAPVREGETFSGWSTLPKTMPAKDVVITGTFSANSYKVTFKVDDEVYEETYVVYGTALTAIDAPTKTGYTFSGWSEMPDTMPAEDVEVTGSFTVNQYKVTFTVDGDTLSSTMVDYGTAISILENPDKEGYTFKGWSPKLDETVPAHDVSYEATFCINSYTITYMVGDEVVHVETVVFGEKIPEYIYESEDERYTFTGWVGEIPETMPADNLTFVADILDSIATLKVNDDAPVFNINGLKMGVASDLKRLPRGIYIVGGKTIIKK